MICRAQMTTLLNTDNKSAVTCIQRTGALLNAKLYSSLNRLYTQNAQVQA